MLLLDNMKKNDKGSELYNSEYSFRNEEQDINEGNDDVNGPEMVTHSRNEGFGLGCHVHEEEEPKSNFGESCSSLYSPFSTDEEDVGPSKPKYSRF